MGKEGINYSPFPCWTGQKVMGLNPKVYLKYEEQLSSSKTVST